nr:carboxypeptidase-like regulatory domain-containing protein [Pseudomonadota bacterium]
TAVSLTDPKAPKVDVLTNRTGRFSASGLAPGRYRITMSGDASLVYDITVVQNAEMLTRFGALKPSAR